MENKIISIDIGPDKQGEINENAGVMWEHNATTLKFNVDSEYIGGYKYYIEYRSLIGTKVRTEYLILDEQTNTITYTIPVTMTCLGGVECYFNIISIDEDGNTIQVIKPRKFCLTFELSPDTDNSIARENDFSVNALFEAIRLGKFKGDKGDKGDPFTREDFTDEEIASLKGDKGDTGKKGDKGDKGDTGAPFTYEDFTPEQLEGLKSKDGIKTISRACNAWELDNGIYIIDIPEYDENGEPITDGVKITNNSDDYYEGFMIVSYSYSAMCQFIYLFSYDFMFDTQNLLNIAVDENGNENKQYSLGKVASQAWVERRLQALESAVAELSIGE